MVLVEKLHTYPKSFVEFFKFHRVAKVSVAIVQGLTLPERKEKSLVLRIY